MHFALPIGTIMGRCWCLCGHSVYPDYELWVLGENRDGLLQQSARNQNFSTNLQPSHDGLLFPVQKIGEFMNHLVRHFLPSQVRGVYRFDDTFKQDDGASYEQFSESKLRFLPCSLIEPIRHCANLAEDFSTVSKQLSLDVQPRDANSRRANAFFDRHPYFQNALQGKKAIEGADNYLEIHFVKNILAPLLNENGLAALQPQRKIGPYYVDFAFDESCKLVIEVDGFGKFSHRSDLDKFIERQNYITCQGWKIIRFTYGQIMHTTKITLKVLHDLLNGDPQSRNFLISNLTATQPRRTLFDVFRTHEEPCLNVFDLVNGFYHVQDWFAEFAIGNPASEVALRDEFDFPFPLVGLAISSLYHFLDAVAAVVAVKFDLPAVMISSPATMAKKWKQHLHPLIAIHKSKSSQMSLMEASVSPLAVQHSSSFHPTPVRSEELISFRRGLSIDEIHQGLDYITREVFGYNDGTKPFQSKVLQRIFDGKETLGISTTGSGKSFCFWLPILLKPGLTLVIAPLRSLMRDQRLTLLNYGICSMEFINSDVEASEQRQYMEEAKLGYLRLLYISPERLRIKKFVEELEALQEFVPINALVIDEAHCISEWGHDFRPSYLKLPSMRTVLAKKNPEFRFLALTATAGELVEKDMRNVLKLNDTDVLREKMADRERFSYQIVPVNDGASKAEAFRKILKEDLATALKKNSLSGLLAQHNSRQEKAVGIVFCIYADPHGKNTIHDGTIHYLFAAMNILEPDKVFMPLRGKQAHPKYDLDAFSTGKVRAFSSKPPTLCPKCYCYEYTSRSDRSLATSDDDDENKVSTKKTDLKPKICLRCNHHFTGEQTLEQHKEKWEKLIEVNQNDFKRSRFDILVATKGFGMGIDKSSVRFVIHTSLSSGIESWYQEVGRAGRDNERAHIVLLADPPNDSCRHELENLVGPKQPRCSWTGGCKHGRKSICDYGKQHLFITKSYPGAETDAIAALRMLDRLVGVHAQTGENSIPIRFNYTDDISRYELALYRLQSLGLIEDYMVAYGQAPRFEVTHGFDGLPDSAEKLELQESMMKISLDAYMSHWDNKKPLNLAMVREKCKPLSNFTVKIKKFKMLSQLDSSSFQYEFFNTVYEHLLLLLDHTYEYVVRMRYNMLWNLCGVVNSWKENQCQRFRILPYFEGAGSVDDSYRCGCCNVCSPELDFRDLVMSRPQNPGVEASTTELNELLRNNILDIMKLRQLCEVFRDYRTNTYAKGRVVLEGNPYNLPALYLTREFSPLAELGANTKLFLQTANEYRIPLVQLAELYKTSAQPLQSELLLLLNDQDTTCDCREGWEFLAEEASNPQHYGNTQISIMRDCLEFFVLVKELPQDTEFLQEKVVKIEEIINA